MSRFARYRVRAVRLAAFFLAVAIAPSMAADGAAAAHLEERPSTIVVGFVGGFVSHENAEHRPVQLAEQLRRNAPTGAYIKVFENRRRKIALRTILQLLDHDHDGKLSDEEKSQARIVLYGHSWGASAALLLARELNRVGVPVLLTVQVDSVAKLWQRDRIIPRNVMAAANFYQAHGILRGQSEIAAADPARTKILGNYRFDYRKARVECDGVSWYDRFLTPGHAQSECDPLLWGEVEQLVRERLAPEGGTLAANPGK